jgi:hypothetical protein
MSCTVFSLVKKKSLGGGGGATNTERIKQQKRPFHPLLPSAPRDTLLHQNPFIQMLLNGSASLIKASNLSRLASGMVQQHRLCTFL